MNNIKCGTSINGGMVLTDMPIEALKAMRDSIDDAIHKAQKDDCDRLETDIVAAIDAARDKGYEVWYDGQPILLNLLGVGANEDEDEDDDDWDDDDDWRDCDYDDDDDDDWYDDEDDPCYGCRDNCSHCPHC